MSPEEVRRKIADMVTEIDVLLDDRSGDVPRETKYYLNRAANELADSYLTVPGRPHRSSNEEEVQE